MNTTTMNTEAANTGTTRLDSALATACALATTAREAMGVAFIDNDEPAGLRGQKDLDAADREIASILAAMDVATARKDARTAQDKAEAAQRLYEEQQQAYRNLQAAAKAVDDGLQVFAKAVRNLIDTKNVAMTVAGYDSPARGTITNAYLALPSIIDYWLALNGRSTLIDDEKAKLAPRFPKPDAED